MSKKSDARKAARESSAQEDASEASSQPDTKKKAKEPSHEYEVLHEGAFIGEKTYKAGDVVRLTEAEARVQTDGGVRLSKREPLDC